MQSACRIYVKIYSRQVHLPVIYHSLWLNSHSTLEEYTSTFSTYKSLNILHTIHSMCSPTQYLRNTLHIIHSVCTQYLRDTLHITHSVCTQYLRHTLHIIHSVCTQYLRDTLHITHSVFIQYLGDTLHIIHSVLEGYPPYHPLSGWYGGILHIIGLLTYKKIKFPHLKKKIDLGLNEIEFFWVHLKCTKTHR